MKWIYYLFFIVLLSCNKNEEPVDHNKSVRKLLTSDTWLLSGIGFDDNDNSILDLSENTIELCQQDNTCTYHLSGSGTVRDNQIKCNSLMDNDFNWELMHGDSVLQINLQQINILHIQDDQLITSPDLPGLSVRFMMTYKR